MNAAAVKRIAPNMAPTAAVTLTCLAMAGAAAAAVLLALSGAMPAAATATATEDAAAPVGLVLVQKEMVSYVDANGIYTIAGNVKNHYDWPVTPQLSIAIRDEHATRVVVDIPYGAIPANGELPFKAKVPYIPGTAVMESHDLSAAPASQSPAGHAELAVMYDHTLVVHAQNGSMSGVAVNSGGSVLIDPVLWAVIHGEDGSALDVARTAPLGIIEPGQSVRFEMHPDPSVSGVSYYSCFAPSDDSVVPLGANRGEQEYNMRYESGAWLYRPVFSEDGSGVTMQTTNSYPFETYASVEIPAVTRSEAFDVLRNGEPIEHQQSIDEMGMWHVTFEIRGQSQDVIEIRGFEQGEVLPALIPDYVRKDLLAWAVGDKNEDAAYDAILLLADREILPDVESGEPNIPEWLKTVVVWWVRDAAISEDAAMAAIAYAIETGLVYVG